MFGGAASAEELGAVGFELGRAGQGRRLGDQKVRGPDRLFVWSAEATMVEEGFATWKPFGFDEEFGESRMRAIGPVRRESEVEVSSHLQTARFARDVDQSHAPDFSVVFCGDNNFRKSLARPACPPELRFVWRETAGGSALGTSHRLMGVAPDCAAFQIPDITNRGRHIAGRGGGPAPDVHVQPAQVTAAGSGNCGWPRCVV